MNALDELLVLPDRKKNPYLKEWKGDGERVVGFACGYVPEEIIHAAGLLPYRMEARGVRETGLADVYTHRFHCTFSRCILQAGLAGDYNFLDGFCLLNGCEHIRGLYEIWKKHLSTDYLYMVAVPHSLNDAGYEWYKEEIYNFKEALRQNFGVRCSTADLSESIKTYNETRCLIEELYRLRKAREVPISGAHALKILLSAGIMPREKYNELLKEALGEITKRDKDLNCKKIRLMVGGSPLDDAMLIEIIEELGGVVVTDSHCFGLRHFMDLIEENGDPLDAIAKRYYYHNSCPRMMGEFKNRLRFTEEMAKEANVDGIILSKIVFCDNHGVESTMLAENLEPKNIPVMALEREHMLSDIGRLKTRIEAFMERIDRR